MTVQAADHATVEPHIRIEWDPAFAGGTPERAGRLAYLPMSAVDAHGVERAFERATGQRRARILDYALDDLYDARGIPLAGESAPCF